MCEKYKSEVIDLPPSHVAVFANKLPPLTNKYGEDLMSAGRVRIHEIRFDMELQKYIVEERKDCDIPINGDPNNVHPNGVIPTTIRLAAQSAIEEDLAQSCEKCQPLRLQHRVPENVQEYGEVYLPESQLQAVRMRVRKKYGTALSGREQEGTQEGELARDDGFEEESSGICYSDSTARRNDEKEENGDDLFRRPMTRSQSSFDGSSQETATPLECSQSLLMVPSQLNHPEITLSQSDDVSVSSQLAFPKRRDRKRILLSSQESTDLDLSVNEFAPTTNSSPIHHASQMFAEFSNPPLQGTMKIK